MIKTLNTYKKSGVNINLANKFVKHISTLSKNNSSKLNKSLNFKNIGSFGSLFDLSRLNIKSPVLVSSTDGVGTKIELAIKYRIFKNIGTDLVAMCVNDIIVMGAKPLFFLDYFATSKLDLRRDKIIINSINSGCKNAMCDLVGGETAEMPGFYPNQKFDLAGFAVGIVSKEKILNKNLVKQGNVILGVPSNGLHSNGFSLVRFILKKNKITSSLKKEIMKPTKIYVKEILDIVNKGLVNTLSHITGGGIVENLPRSIPDNLSANIFLNKLKTQTIFSWIKSKGVSEKEMLKTFNCGVGMCIIASKKNVKKIQKYFPKKYRPFEFGVITNKGRNKINFLNKIKW